MEESPEADEEPPERAPIEEDPEPEPSIPLPPLLPVLRVARPPPDPPPLPPLLEEEVPDVVPVDVAPAGAQLP